MVSIKYLHRIFPIFLAVTLYIIIFPQYDNSLFSPNFLNFPENHSATLTSSVTDWNRRLVHDFRSWAALESNLHLAEYMVELSDKSCLMKTVTPVIWLE